MPKQEEKIDPTDAAVMLAIKFVAFIIRWMIISWIFWQAFVAIGAPHLK